MPLAAWTSVLGPDHDLHVGTDRIWYVTTTDGREFVLKKPMSWDPDAPRLRLAREYRILSHLGAAGVPVAAPIITDDGNICAAEGDDLYVLLPRIRFDTGMPEERPDAPDAYRRVGAAIAGMDVALANCPFGIASYEIVLDQRLTPETCPLLRVADPALARKLDRLAAPMRAATAGLPQQLTHGDCHDGNVLLRDGHVAGFIDLDHLSTAPRICDANRWLGNRILWAMQSPAERWPIFVTLVDALLAGYDEVGGLSEQERRAIGPALLINELDTAEWCLGQGDDSSSYATGLIRACHWLADRDATLS